MDYSPRGPMLDRPMIMPNHLALVAPDLRGHELAFLAEAFRRFEIGPSGTFRDRFEQEFSALQGTRFALSLSSGTAALHVALASLGLGPGDEVIVPAATYVATANAVLYTGATPVLVDVDADTWCLDPAAVARALSPRTRAVIPVHMLGRPAALDALQGLPGDIPIVEDAAHVARRKDSPPFPARPPGRIAAFSFALNKTITCGEGGCLCLDDADLFHRAASLRAHGMPVGKTGVFERLGYNYRLSNLHCAILCAQLERIDQIVHQRQNLERILRERLAAIPGLELQAPSSDPYGCAWYVGVVVGESYGRERDDLIAALRERGIETRPFFPPLHHIPHLRAQARHAEDPPAVAERLGRRALLLPVHWRMTETDCIRIGDALEDLRAKASRQG